MNEWLAGWMNQERTCVRIHEGLRFKRNFSENKKNNILIIKNKNFLIIKNKAFFGLEMNFVALIKIFQKKNKSELFKVENFSLFFEFSFPRITSTCTMRVFR